MIAVKIEISNYLIKIKFDSFYIVLEIDLKRISLLFDI